MIDSYFIINVMNLFYQVQFFKSTKIFDTFYLNLLRKASENSLLKQVNEFASSIIIDDKKTKNKQYF